MPPTRGGLGGFHDCSWRTGTLPAQREQSVGGLLDQSVDQE